MRFFRIAIATIVMMTVLLTHPVNAADTAGNDTEVVAAPASSTTTGNEEIITPIPEKTGKKVIALIIANNAEEFGDDYLPSAQINFAFLLPRDKYGYVTLEKVKKALKERKISVRNPKKARLVELGKDLNADYVLYTRLEKVKFGQGLGSLPIGTQIRGEVNVGIKINLLETATENDLVNNTFSTNEAFKANIVPVIIPIFGGHTDWNPRQLVFDTFIKCQKDVNKAILESLNPPKENPPIESSKPLSTEANKI